MGTLGMYLLIAFLSLLSIALADPDSTDKQLLWGPYRPNLYFGVRPRIPKSLSFGFMWAAVENQQLNTKQLRHTCEQNDGMTQYGWSIYDVRTGGFQTISDPGNNVNLTVEFTKSPGSKNDWGDWSVSIKGEPAGGSRKNWNVSAIFYLNTEDTDHRTTEKEIDGIQCLNFRGTVKCDGATDGIGQFNVVMPRPNLKTKSRTVLKSLTVPSDRLWDAKSTFLDQVMRSGEVYPFVEDKLRGGNIHYIQRSHESSFKFDVHFRSEPYAQSLKGAEAGNPTKSIQEVSKSFSGRFNNVFKPGESYSGEAYTKFSQSLLSNLLGGIGYFYGDRKISDSSDPSSTITVKATSLFTAVPSRALFPRGFLWDEGFHLLVIADWDMDLALEILQSWLALMDDKGWIAREQILGPEARSKVPGDFHVQIADFANPPTLFLVVEALIDKVSGKSKYLGAHSAHLDLENAKKFLREVYPKLKKHYEWIRETQKGDLKPDFGSDRSGFDLVGYRWRGQTDKHIFTSGFDDYPRSQPQTGDLHVDAISWVGMMSGILIKVAKFLDEEHDGRIFVQHKKDIAHSIEMIHWSETSQTYCDTTVTDDHRTPVCHRGYLSILPFLLGHMDSNHPHLLSTLNLMRDEKELWSPHGLRSLSQSDEYYGTDENYWRGPIWININYLAITRLMELARTHGPHQSLAKNMYTKLRHNIVTTVFNSWQSTGFAWEQYNPETGAGQRAQGFTGWTALIVNILALPDLDVAETTFESGNGTGSSHFAQELDDSRLGKEFDDSRFGKEQDENSPEQEPDLTSDPMSFREKEKWGLQIFVAMMGFLTLYVLRRRVSGLFGRWNRVVGRASADGDVGLGRYEYERIVV